ncbi:MAG TPA: SRPBCC family protein [Jatrophihabitans sp.]|nr:SRPBCC family protein [Jatrophihabitans sp.]
MTPTTHHPTTITAAPGTPFLEVVREFDAPPALVFRAATEPEFVTRWLGPRNRQMRIEAWDARTGGGYRYFHYTDGEDFEAGFRGVFHTVEPDHIVIQTFEFDGAPNQVALETATYEDLGDGRTRLITRSVFPSVAARDMAIQVGMNEGINDSMDRLAELLESGDV